MVVNREKKGSWRTFTRSLYATGALAFSFVAIFFSKMPHSWSPTKISKNTGTDFFGPDVAHADVLASGGPPPSSGGSPC